MKRLFRFVLLCHIYYKVVCGQCILRLQLHQFENEYNVDARKSDEICCCDRGDNNCNTDLDSFSTDTCGSSKLCDTFFVVTLSECLLANPCPTMLLSEVFTDTPTGTNVQYNFSFVLTAAPSEPYSISINMRDAQGKQFREIDTFEIEIPLSVDIQEQKYKGERGIASITLTTDLTCIEPDTCDPTTTALNSAIAPITTLIPSVSFCTTETEVLTSTQIVTSTSVAMTTETEVVTSTHVINSTSVASAFSGATCSLATSVAKTQFVSFTCTATSTTTVIEATTLSTWVTISATPTVISTVCANSSSEEESLAIAEQSSGPTSDGTSIVWMSLFITFLLLTISAVAIIVYFACVLKKRKKDDYNVCSKSNKFAVSHANSSPDMDKPAFGTKIMTSEIDNVCYASESQEVYLPNAIYDEAGEMYPNSNYSEHGPAESSDYCGIYDQPEMLDEGGGNPYEAPQSFFTDK